MTGMTEYWEPRTEADLEAANTQGLLRETHIFDAKKQPPPSHKNESIATDFACFAIDGGRILYGADQPKSNGPTTLTPFDTSGLAERLELIARSGLIDPPLRIRCEDIPSVTKPGLGYLLAVIPRSPDAPHQVGSQYRGRSDRTNMVLSDVEVRRIMAEREERQRDIAALLQDEVARDPTGPDLRNQGHLFVVAQPIRAHRHLLSRAIGTQDWQLWLQSEFRERVLSFQPPQGAGPLDLFVSGASHLTPRQSGWAVHTYEMAPDRHIQPNGAYPAKEDQLLDLEIRDDGGLRLFCARASFDWPKQGNFIFEHLIVTLTRRMARAAAAVSDKAQFLGEWGFGLALRGIGTGYINRGLISGNVTYRVDDYDETATVSTEQVQKEPDIVVRILLTRFARGLGRVDYIPGLEGLV